MKTPGYRNLVIVIGLGLASSSLPSSADSLDVAALFSDAKSRGLQQANASESVYTYDIAIEDEEMRATGTVTMSAPEGQRLTVHQPPKDEWSEEFEAEITEYEKNLGKDFWCQGLMEDIESFSEARQASEGMVFDVNLKIDADDKEAAKFAKNMEVKVTLSPDDAAVLGYSMRAPKPFRPVMIAKIKRFELDIACERAPDGRTYAKRMQSNIEGRAMMKKFSQKETRVVSNLRLPQ